MHEAAAARARRVGCSSSTIELPFTKWCYILAPVHALPTIDLSKSLHSKLLPPKATQLTVQLLARYHRILSALYAICLALNVAVPLVDAPTGRVLAKCAFVCGLPLALGSIASLRYDVLKLLVRTYDFWFYALVNVVTYGAIAASFRDARMCRAVIDTIGFQNMVLSDAQLLGVRHLIRAGAIAIGALSILLACVVVNEIDQVDFTYAVLHYKTAVRAYTVTTGDVVANGLITMLIALLKIVFRKRSALRRRQQALQSRSSSSSSSSSCIGGSTVECAIYRCSVQLVPVVAPPASAIAPVANTLTEPPGTRRLTLRPGSSLQRMCFVDRAVVFDARHTMVPMPIESSEPFSRAARAALYTAGVLGALCNGTAVVLAVVASENHNDDDSYNTRAWWCAVLAFALSASFTTVCTALYQHKLLAALLTSFDFFFYALHFVCMHASLCVLYRRDRAVVCVSVTALLWVFWLLTIDALTPVVRAKLGFHVRWALPVVAIGGAIHTVLLVHLVSDAGPLDVVIWEGGVLARHLQVRVAPLYISRVVTLVPWFFRFSARLLRASNCDATILRASVTYQHRSRNQHQHGVAPGPSLPLDRRGANAPARATL